MAYFLIKGDVTHSIFDDIVLCRVGGWNIPGMPKLWSRTTITSANPRNWIFMAKDLDDAQLTVMALVGIHVEKADESCVRPGVVQRLMGGKYDS
jgi:hypothetical protein